MPMALGPIIGAGLAAVGGFTGGFLGITGVAGALLAGTSSLALSALSGAFGGAKKPKAQPSGVQFNVRQATAPWRVIYGRARVGGVFTFLGTDNDGGPNRKLHMALTFAGHQIEAYERWWLDEEELRLKPATDVADEFIPIGRLEHNADMSPRYGTADQTAPSGLVGVGTDEGGEWTAAHRQRGRAYAYWRFHYNAEKFPNGAPNVSALIKGRNQVYDPRDGGTRWTDNAALCIADYLTSAAFGLGADYDTEMGEEELIAAANACDELVETPALSDTFTVGKATTFQGFTSKQYTYQETREVHDQTQTITTTTTVTNVIDLANPGSVSLARGTKVYLTGSGLPGGLSAGTAYYWIPVALTTIDNSNPTGNALGKLASSLANATAGTAITISADGSGSINVTTELELQGTTLDMMGPGDVVRVSSSGSLPTGLSAGVDYYWIPRAIRQGELASSLANARAGTAVGITSVGSGTLTIERTKEPRYTLNGSFTTDARPREVIEKMLSAMAGRAVYVGGKWRIFAGVYQTPQVTLDEDDLAGPVKLQALQSRRDNFNRVKGTFTSPADRWQETDFPAVTNATYLAQDNDEKVWKDLDLPFTDSAGMAQRLAKIELERSRQQIGVVLPCKLTAFRVRAGDTVYLTLARMGWSGKAFDVLESTFAVNADGTLGVELTVRETASTVFDWDSGEETVLDPAPNTSLPSPFTVPPPSDLNVTEELYETRNSAGVKARAIVTVTAAPDAFVRAYQVEYRLVGASDFTPAGETPGTTKNLDDLAPGTYEFRVRSVSLLSVPSLWISKTAMIAGLLAPPEEPQDLTGQVLSGFVHIAWTQVADLDVRIGGRIEFRHSPLSVGATWNSAVPIGLAVPGGTTFTILPYLPGTYLAKSVDSSGVPSTAAAELVLDGGPAVGATLDSVTEDPTFAGTKTNLIVDSGALQLDTGETSGTYEFAGVIDLGSVQAVRVSRSVTYTVTAPGALIDDRTDPIDSWPDIDGASDADAGEVTVWVAATDDDPSGTAVWSAWQRLDAADFYARGFKFKAEVSADESYNVLITALSAKAEALP